VAQRLTSDQILALAPDSSSAKAGAALATARKWSGLGANETAAWGECQGSGKLPYQARIDLLEAAFKCTCPSRKFPCKHGLGLYLLLASDPGLFSGGDSPSWVTEWLTSRAERTERKQQREAAPDPEAQAKRAAAREAKVASGLDELELWMRDREWALALAQALPAEPTLEQLLQVLPEPERDALLCRAAENADDSVLISQISRFPGPWSLRLTRTVLKRIRKAGENERRDLSRLALAALPFLHPEAAADISADWPPEMADLAAGIQFKHNLVCDIRNRC
jgi:hypothetical protein